MRVLSLCSTRPRVNKSPSVGVKIKITGKCFAQKTPPDTGEAGDVVKVRTYEFRPKILTNLALNMRDDQ